MNESEKVLAGWSIAWEGCISLARQKQGTHLYLLSYVNIKNTEKALVDKFATIIKQGKVVFAFKGREHTRPTWLWQLVGQKQVTPFLEEIKDYLPSDRKRKCAYLVLEFCKIRATRATRTPYTERCWKIKKEITELNHRGYGLYNHNKEVKKLV